MTVVGDDEAMQIKLEPVLHSGTVDLGYQPAGFGERGPIKAYPVPDIDQFVRRLSRVPPAPAADMDPEFLLQRSQLALQGTYDAGRDPGGMPIHAHHGSERLEPEWVRGAATIRRDRNDGQSLRR
jgi:hypothetical protein